MGFQQCFICRDHLINPNFNFEHANVNAKILCQLLRLPLNYPISSEISSFPDLFESASYCPPCAVKIKAIGHILKDIEELERKLQEHRSEIEEQLKNNLKVTENLLQCPYNDLESSDASKANHLVWTTVINYIEKSGCRVEIENEEIEFQSDAQLDAVDPLEINNESQGQGCVDYYDPEFSAPLPSPSSHEEKYDPCRDKDLDTDESCVSDLIIQTKTPSSGEIESLAVSSGKLTRRKRPYSGPIPRTRCWFADDCNVWIRKFNDISSEAHRLKCHEGIKKCYICKICNEGFLTYKALRYHAKSHVTEDLDDDDHKSMTLTLPAMKRKKSETDLFIPPKYSPEEISGIMKNPFPIIRLTRLDDIPATEAETAKVKVRPMSIAIGTDSQKAKSLVGINVKLKQKPKPKSQITETKSISGKIRRTKCPYDGCHVKFISVKRKESHIWKCHEKLKEDYICGHDVCPARFATLEKWHAHITSEHNGGIPAPFCCPFCQVDFEYLLPLRQHVFSVHEPHKAKYKCEEPGCGKLFQEKKNLDEHKITHAQTKRYLCEFCSDAFTNPQRLKYHRSSKHSTQANVDSYTCKNCGLNFASPPCLRDHVRRVHEKTFKFKCQICGYGAMNKSGLKTHAVVHTSERPFMCDKCPATFKRKPEMNEHSRRHELEGIRAFKCSICPAAFTMKDGLTRHELIHSKAQCHVCTICGRTFPIRNYLTLHMRNFHKIRNKDKKSKSISTMTGPNVEIDVNLSNVALPGEPQNYSTASANNEFEDFINL